MKRQSPLHESLELKSRNSSPGQPPAVFADDRCRRHLPDRAPSPGGRVSRRSAQRETKHRWHRHRRHGGNNLVNLESQNIVALCDVDLTYAANTIAKYPGAKVWTDYREMLEKQKDIDAVLI